VSSPPTAAAHWSLDPDVTFLNHGSYGACPRAVLERQAKLRARLEEQPVRFFLREAPSLLDDARVAMSQFVGAEAEDVAFVPNATTGVNAVLRSLPFAPGDELLCTDHGYNACTNALRYVAERTGARVVVAQVPFPLEGSWQVVEAVLAAATPRTRLALLDHVTSPTGLIFPIEELVRALAERGVDTLVDGAHAAGMVPLSVAKLGAAYYTGNWHKWVCAPKGAGFLWVRRDRQDAIHPTTISHGRNADRTDRSRFWLEFDWTGTADLTPYLCVPEAIRVLGSLVSGGWPSLMQHNRTLVLDGRQRLSTALGLERPPCPDDMIGSLATVPLSDGPMPQGLIDPLQDALFARGIEVPVMSWPAAPRRVLRISAQLYNRPADYDALVTALRELSENAQA
jgi:isopenicillin-N epimerase